MLYGANFENYYLYVTLVTKFACVCVCLGKKRKRERGRHFLKGHADCTLFEHVIGCLHRVLHSRVAMVMAVVAVVLNRVGVSFSGGKL